MFFRSKAPVLPDVIITAGLYRRWLRAQRPPFDMFLRMTEAEQDYLAMLGDEYVSSIAGDIAEEAAAAREEKAVQAIAAQATQELLGRNRQAPAPSMSGFGQRRTGKKGALGQKVKESDKS